MNLADDPKFQEIKQRSMNAAGTMYCGECYFSYVYTGFACWRHLTDEERQDRDKKMIEYMNNVDFNRPFFDALRKKQGS